MKFINGNIKPPNSENEHQILEFMRQPGYQPLRQNELAKAMRIPESARSVFRAALRNLEKREEVVRLRKNRFCVATGETADRAGLTGILRFTPDGFAVAETDSGKAFFIPKDRTGCALHKDTVEIEPLPPREAKGRRGRKGYAASDRLEEARVCRVIERHFTEVVGLIRHTPYYSYVIPDHPRLPQTVRVECIQKKKRPSEDHKVLVRLLPWTDPYKPLCGEVTEDIGHRDDPGVAMQCIVRSYGYEQQFPDPVMEETAEILTHADDLNLKDREDWRSETVFTIDPESARDFDDALSIAPHLEGGWKIGVHIADVAHYIKPGSEIDKEAARRGNSVYLVDRVIMMLPKELTAGVCSLKPNCDRPSHSVELHLDPDGRLLNSRTFRAVIHSKARLSYDQVQQFFEDATQTKGIPTEVVQALKHLRPLARKIRQRRMQAGAVEVSSPEVDCVLDQNGDVSDIRPRCQKEAYALVEEMMLLANVAVAEKTVRHGLPSLYRIHEEPDPEQWAAMGTQLLSLGIAQSPQTRNDINRLMQGLAEGPLKFAATLCILRNFKRAMYCSEPAPHFGLAFDRYSHFTSPIRRYPDLITHRVLTAFEVGKKTSYTAKQLDAVATHCAETEYQAEQAEKESVELKRVEYFQRQLMAGETGPYRATVIKLLNRGMIVETNDALQRGLVAFADLHDDYYAANPEGTRVHGERHGRGWTIGDEVEVELVKVDTVRRFVDFRLTDARYEKKGSRSTKPGKENRRRGGPPRRKGSSPKRLPKGSVRRRH